MLGRVSCLLGLEHPDSPFLPLAVLKARVTQGPGVGRSSWGQSQGLRYSLSTGSSFLFLGHLGPLPLHVTMPAAHPNFLHDSLGVPRAPRWKLLGPSRIGAATGRETLVL